MIEFVVDRVNRSGSIKPESILMKMMYSNIDCFLIIISYDDIICNLNQKPMFCIGIEIKIALKPLFLIAHSVIMNYLKRLTFNNDKPQNSFCYNKKNLAEYLDSRLYHPLAVFFLSGK